MPRDPIAESLLAAAIRQAATDRPSAVGGAPDLAKAISGKAYRFGENALKVRTVALNFFESDSSWEVAVNTGRPNQPVQRFSGLMGLDGIYRKSPPAAYGINAAKARWLNGHTLMLERRVLGHGETQTWTLAFDGDAVTVSFADTDGSRAELRGQASD